MMHFESPSNLKDTVTNNLLTQSLLEIVPLDDTRTSRNKKVICTSVIDTLKLTFNYFPNINVKTLDVEAYCSRINIIFCQCMHNFKKIQIFYIENL